MDHLAGSLEIPVEYANFVWFLQEYVGKESYQQAVKDVSTSMTQKLVQGGFKPGVDFNLHPDGRMLASKEANEYLENYQVNSDPTLGST